MAERAFVRADQLQDLVREALGPGRPVREAIRLRGGSKKGVYRLVLGDGATVVLYVWDASEDYWSHLDAAADCADPFAAASGIDLFAAARARLDAVGVPTPEVYLLDGSRRHLPADVAVVEDVRGGSLEQFLQRDPRRAVPVLERLGGALDRMRLDRSVHVGKVAVVEAGAAGAGRSCEEMVLDRALRDLATAAERLSRMAEVRDRVEEVVRERAAAVSARAEHGLVHGELGPDHVLVDEQGEPVLIDIEGLMFFDVEWEHAFVQLRFGEHARWLRTEGLDEQRMQFYRLALHLSLVAGPLRLLDGDFPERAGMLRIVEHNLERTLDAVRGA